jgi:uncharacterized protein involved in exopolysaccharide biosynthesis
MEQQVLTIDDYVGILVRRKWHLILPGVLVFMIATGVALALPTRYKSTATILIEQQEIPIDLVRSTVTSFADQRVQVIRQRVMTSENLSQIIERYNLYPKIREKRGIAAAVERMRKDSQMQMISAEVVDPRSGRPAAATIAFTLSFDAGSPIEAQRVANDIVSLFLDENLRERKRTAQDATRFLEQESTKLAEQVSSLEARLAQFKEQYGDAVPEMMEVNLQLMERTDDRIRQIDLEIATLEQNQVYLRAELAKIGPYSAMFSQTGDRILGPADRLKALEAELVTARSRYSENHPDRVAIEREIEMLRREVGQRAGDDLRRLLEKQKSDLASLKGRYSAEHPDVQSLEREIALTTERLRSAPSSAAPGTATAPISDADNPAYIQLQAQLAGNQSQVASLRQSKSELEARLRDFEARIAQAPKVEREYRLITRDYETALNKYNQVRSKLMEASLAESLETERKGERFTLIEPPALPDRPFSPNRPVIVFLGMILAAGAGGGTLIAREVTDKGLYTVRQVQGIAGAPPLAVIPRIESPADRRKRIILIVGSVILFFLIVLGLVGAVHFFYKPVDVLWFKILERFA